MRWLGQRESTFGGFGPRLGVAILWALGPVSATAASDAPAALSVSVSPAHLELRISPGQSVARGIYFLNQTNQPMRVQAGMRDLRIDDRGVPHSLPANTDPRSLVSWSTLRPSSQSVAPGETAVFQMAISAPPQAAGAYYGEALLSGQMVSSAAPGNSVGLAPSLVVRILVDTGSVAPVLRAEVAGVRVPTPTRALAMDVVVTNVGQVHTRFSAFVDLLGPMKDFVGHLIVAESDILILAGQTKRLTFVWPGHLYPATYEAVATVYYGDAGVALGTAVFSVGEPAQDREPDRSR